MSRSQLVSAATDGVSGAVPSCVEDATTLCAKVYDWFGLDLLAANADTLIATPAKMLMIVLRRETSVGHGARAVSRTVELAADQLAFLAEHAGLDGV